MRFAFGDLTLVAKSIEGKFPDFEGVIPKNPTKRALLPRAAVQLSLHRLVLGTNDKFRGVRWALTPGSVKLSCGNPAQQQALGEIDVDYAGGSLEIAFNVDYVLDMLARLEVDSIECSLGDALTPALFKMADRDDFKYVVMPKRIQEADRTEGRNQSQPRHRSLPFFGSIGNRI